MSLTIAKVGDNALDFYGATPAAIFDITMDAAYPAGGYVVTAANFGLRSLAALIVIQTNTAASLSAFQYNTQTGKLMVLGAGGGAAGTIAFADNSTANLSTYVVRVLALGLR